MERHPVDDIVRLRELPSGSEQTDGCNARPHSPDLFVYCSVPRPVLDVEVSGGLYGRPLYRDNALKPKGMHSYYNISWDPRVRRGDPLQTRKRREQLECEKIRRKLTEPRKRDDKHLSKEERRARTSDPQAMIRAANMRYARLAISNLRPKEKDAFLVELTDELDQDEICYKGQRIGAAKVLPKVPSRKRNLVDQALQIWPEDFFNFEHEVVPVLERLIGAVCYQARREVLEETELEALRLERQLFEEKKRREEQEMLMFKTRVEKHIAEEKRLSDLARAKLRDEIEGKTSVSLFAGVFVKYDTEAGLRASGDEWDLYQATRRAIQEEFVSWANDAVHMKMKFYEAATKLLDDIIGRAVAEREAEHAASIWKDVYGQENPIRYFTQETESSRVPPPTPGTSSYYTSDEEEHEISVSPSHVAHET